MGAIEYLDPDTSFKHWIAHDLRFFREREGFSLAQMGRIMGCNRHNVSNIAARLVRYARAADDPDWFLDYAKYEALARVIRLYRLSLMPGLFQTPDYARAVISAFRMVDDVEAAVEARMKRQEVLARRIIGACALPWDASRDLITKAMERFS